MSLVKPLVPSHLSSLIYAGQTSDTACGSSHSLEQLVEDLVYEDRCDRREQARKCREALEIQLQSARQSSEEEKDIHRINLESRLFAAHLIESLWNLRIHDAKASRAALNNARKLAGAKSCSIPPVVVLESLGLVSALVTKLEDHLARIEPCL
jgi:hypothetical protein